VFIIPAPLTLFVYKQKFMTKQNINYRFPLTFYSLCRVLDHTKSDAKVKPSRLINPKYF